MSKYNLVYRFSDYFGFRENNCKTVFLLDFLFKIDIFIPQGGESIIPHLHCCDAFIARSKATW